MRLLVVLAFIITVISVIYKWRYRVVNTLLAIRFLRRIVVAITMNMPAIKNKLLPKRYEHQTS